MRRSVLSRSLIAVAGLAVAAGALSAVPASAAATPSGITREQVMAAADAARADPPVGDHPQSVTTVAAVRPLVDRFCPLNTAAEQESSVFVAATSPEDGAIGIIVLVGIADPTLQFPLWGARFCTFGAVATADQNAALTGTATLKGPETFTDAMSGDAFVTPAHHYTFIDAFTLYPTWNAKFSFSVVGTATRSTSSTVTISTPKTAQQKNAAKKKYAKALSSAKKSYKKAVKKAGHSKSKKAKKAKSKAKKTYAKKRAVATTTYKKSIASTHSPLTTTKMEDRPIAVSADLSLV